MSGNNNHKCMHTVSKSYQLSTLFVCLFSSCFLCIHRYLKLEVTHKDQVYLSNGLRRKCTFLIATKRTAVLHTVIKGQNAAMGNTSCEVLQLQTQKDSCSSEMQTGLHTSASSSSSNWCVQWKQPLDSTWEVVRGQKVLIEKFIQNRQICFTWEEHISKLSVSFHMALKLFFFFCVHQTLQQLLRYLLSSFQSSLFLGC